MKILPVLGKQEGVAQYWAEMQKYGAEVGEKNPQYIVVLGGDGTFLGAEREYYQLGVPFVGVGFGRVNFLLNRFVGAPKEFMKNLEKKNWINFPIYGISAEIETKNGSERGIAFNDVYLKALDPTRVIRLELVTREYEKLEVIGDGVIIATPQGSTAYNRNAGGTILPLGSSLWCLTGICTQKRLRVTVGQQEIAIKVQSENVVLVTDNKIFYDAQEVKLFPSAYQGIICFGAQENFEQRRYDV